MNFFENPMFQRRHTLLEILQQRGWKPSRDRGGDEVAGLCPLHRDSHPSFYVNRRKQLFYCHGCGRGGGLTQLLHFLHQITESSKVPPAPDELLDQVYHFYQQQLVQHEEAQQYLAGRGLHDRDVMERMRIGYAPGACLRGYLERLGYRRQTLLECGLVDEQGRDRFFRCLTFPLVEAENLYGRSIRDGFYRHHFLPVSKGGLYGWPQSLAYPRVLVVEGVFDAAALWQAGFPNAVAGLGSHLNNRQLSELCQPAGRLTYICFDADRTGSGQRAARRLSIQLRHAGVEALRVELPAGHDPASFFAAGAKACDFRRCLDRAQP